jgi:hypothetical protein
MFTFLFYWMALQLPSLPPIAAQLIAAAYGDRLVDIWNKRDNGPSVPQCPNVQVLLNAVLMN